jgi:hypothetical protein
MRERDGAGDWGWRTECEVEVLLLKFVCNFSAEGQSLMQSESLGEIDWRREVRREICVEEDGVSRRPPVMSGFGTGRCSSERCCSIAISGCASSLPSCIAEVPVVSRRWVSNRSTLLSVV